VVSDAHEGLVRATDEAFPGAAWQECQTHLYDEPWISGGTWTSRPSVRTWG
jgi:hypothetical protein